MRSFIFSSFCFFCFSVNADIVCNSENSKCFKTGKAAVWLLSIIESSVKKCPESQEVDAWLVKNNWYVSKVKQRSKEYQYLFNTQLTKYWNKDNPDFLGNCSKVTEQVLKRHPLNEELR